VHGLWGKKRERRGDVEKGNRKWKATNGEKSCVVIKTTKWGEVRGRRRGKEGGMEKHPQIWGTACSKGHSPNPEG